MRANILILSLLFLVFSCENRQVEQTTSVGLNISWSPIDSINANLPPGIEVFQGREAEANLRLWYVRIRESDPRITTRVVVGDDSDGRETVSEFAARLDVPVLINGGYFRMDKNPATHVGILKVDDRLLHSATHSVLRGEQRFYLTRSALVLDEDDHVSIDWVSTQGDSVFVWDQPWENAPDAPGEAKEAAEHQFTAARDILGAGPVLIKNGEIRIAVDDEVFFGTSIPDTHPRTAVGITREKELILLLVDGRQLISRGVNLEELASILFDLGCIDALNLDGGGSSALVVNGILLNRPAGSTEQREVMSALAVFYE